MRILQVTVLAAVIAACIGSKILVLVPMPSRSHSILFERLVAELADKGHEVTFISPYALPEPVKNVKEITLTDVHEILKNRNQAGLFQKIPQILMMFIVNFIGQKIVDGVMKDEKMKELMQSDEKFDLVIGEIFVDEAILAGFSHKFNAPIIGVATSLPNIWTYYMIGNPAPPSYIPDYLLGYPSKMTFCQRFINMVMGSLIEVNHRVMHMSKQDSIMRQYFGDDLPPIQDIIKNTSLVLVNHHHVLGYPRPALPNMIEVGGYHVPAPKKLPKDLQKFMDDSKQGVVLFSMGSNFRSSEMPEENLKSILDAFSRLKENVLWKFETEDLKDLPKNVKISKWLPQSDILAHPNLKLFITHGGQLSTTEAVVRGVPVLGIPIMADQHTNMKQAEILGYGKTLVYSNLSADYLYDTIIEILNNPRFGEVAKERSQLLLDSPLKPMERALFWIEYILRHKGAPHLRSASQDLEWYQYYLVDAIAFLILIVSVQSYVSYRFGKFIYKRVFKRKCNKNETEKKNQ